MSGKNIIFVQRRPTRAGAQTSLYRLVSTIQERAIVLTSSLGWLTSMLPHTHVAPSPSARSLAGRLGGLKHAARNIAKKIQASIVVANDYHECPMALALAKEMNVPCLAILRASGMTRRDFEKYHCAKCDHLFIVGEELNTKALQWTSTPISLFQEGFLEGDFFPPREPAETFPEKILVAGTSNPLKGFHDLLAALEILEAQNPDFPIKEVVLTSTPLNASIPKLRAKLNFVGRIENFISFAQNFQFAIHPSQAETFGLAPLELIISGIPTLCTRTGALNEDLLPSSWLSPPASPKDLATVLENWIKHWSVHCQELPGVIQKIKTQYHIEETSKELFTTIRRLTSKD